MKIQLAIDRVSLGEAVAIALAAGPAVDIVEVGTSLIKEYGLLSVRELRAAVKGPQILADMKIMDEAAYEAEAAFAAGADIVTVMGAAARESMAACEAVAARAGKQYMMDMMGLAPGRIRALQQEFGGIVCLHLPADAGGDLGALVEALAGGGNGNRVLAAAGGVTPALLPALKRAGVHIAVIGGAITKSGDIAAAARQCKEAAG